VVIKVRKSGGASDAGSYAYAGEHLTETESQRFETLAWYPMAYFLGANHPLEGWV
jgi:hypothetical protein